MFELRYTNVANEDLLRLSRDNPNAFRKALKLLDELKEHPRTGTGKPEPLSADRAGQWSRRITRRHRLVYEIYDTEVVVLVLTAYGHYGES